MSSPMNVRSGGRVFDPEAAQAGLPLQPSYQDLVDDMEGHSDHHDGYESEECDSLASHSVSHRHHHSSSSTIHNPSSVDSCAESSSESQNASINHTELRKRIVLIQQDTTLSAPEKARKIQQLMSGGWNKQKQQSNRTSAAANKLSDKLQDFDHVSDEDRMKTYHNADAQILGCKHYQRGAKLQAHCCGRWFTCRFCHDEISDHNIVRNLTKKMMCMHCSTVQPAGQTCVNPSCLKEVARYYCADCKLWDDDPKKNIYHCKDCGICRIGKGLGRDYFHCTKCNVCMAISLKGRHKCIERNLESDCPICGEYMFTSTTTVIFMPCGHCIHYKCHQEYIQTSYQCPTCFKSLANMTEYFRRIDAMLAQHTMPPEYEFTKSHVYCNDCEKKSYAKFHFLYHKCGHCGGYNSKVLQTVEMRPGTVLSADSSTDVSSTSGSVIRSTIARASEPETAAGFARQSSSDDDVLMTQAESDGSFLNASQVPDGRTSFSTISNRSGRPSTSSSTSM